MHFALIPGDSISNHVIEIDGRLRAQGLESSIFAGKIAPELAGRVHPQSEYLAHMYASDEVLIYHYGLYDSPGVRYFQASRGLRVLIYHNITPAHYFRGWSREQELLCDVGQQTLPALAGCDLALGVSEFNRRQLVEAGFDEAGTGVLPIFLAEDRFETLPTNRPLLDRLQRGSTTNFVTVGRVAPNKAIEDSIRIFAIYHRAINPNSRLLVIGSRYLPTYDAALDALVDDLGLGQAVTFTGLVSDADLKTYYQAADLYLHASHHEGFCVPLLESMYFDLPILAREAGAVPETLSQAGVLFTRPGYEEVAEMAHLLLDDARLRSRVIARQRERLADFAPAGVEARLWSLLGRLGISPGSPLTGEGG